jgi:hypothetical protein
MNIPLLVLPAAAFVVFVLLPAIVFSLMQRPEIFYQVGDSVDQAWESLRHLFF